MSSVATRIVVDRYSRDGYPIQTVEPVYDYNAVMYRPNPNSRGKIWGKPVIHNWREQLLSGKNMVGNWIPTDDKRHIIKILYQVDYRNSWVIETAYGVHDINQRIEGAVDIGATGEDFAWLEDEDLLRGFALAWLANYGNYVRALAVYCRPVHPKYIKKVFGILIRHPVVQDELRSTLRKAYEENGIDLVGLIADKVSLYEELKEKGTKEAAKRNKMIREMIDDVTSGGDVKGIDKKEMLNEGRGALAKLQTNSERIVKQMKKHYEVKSKYGEKAKVEDIYGKN